MSPTPEAPLSPARAALLDQILVEGGRRRRRRRQALTGGLGVALLATLLVVVPGRGGTVDEINVADDPVPTTSAPTTTTTMAPETDTDQDEAPTVAADDREQDVEAPDTSAPASPPPTEAPLVCRNSFDPRCGPFYWDLPDDFVNQPMTITMEQDRQIVLVGQPVTFTFTFVDPDWRSGANCAFADFEGVISSPGASGTHRERFPCAVAACPERFPFGPWDPPPVQEGAGEPDRAEATVTFATRGTHQITVTSGAPPDCPPTSPYASEATETFTVTVL